MGVIDKNTGELRSTYDILHDLADAWDHRDYDKFRHGSRGN